MGKYHAHGCIMADTKIKLLSGEIKTIEELFNSEQKEFEILCVNEDGEVCASKMNHVRIGTYANEIYHIHLSDDSIISVTNNHPFLLNSLQWKRADELNVNDELFVSSWFEGNDNKYHAEIKQPYAHKKPVHRIVAECKYDYIKPKYHIHHIDHNVNNNSFDNLCKLSNSEHGKAHGKRPESLAAYDRGRERMIHGDLKEQNKVKNHFIICQYNKNQTLYKAMKIIRELKELNMELSVENYNKLRSDKNHYNYPYIDRLIKKGKIKKFEDLIEMVNNNVSFIKFDKNEVYKNINYIDTKIKKVTKRKKKKFIKFKKIYIINIEIEKVNNVPMYDFTVDKYENALFIVDKEKHNDNITRYNMICLHNSVYGTMVNLSQDWNMRYPLLNFHGNNGSIDGDTAAANRYTECKLHKNAMELLNGLDEDGVDFHPNYSETLLEPEVLPGLLPNLLLNGAYGIAVGYTTKIPSHNISEVIDGIIYVIKNPKSELKDIMKYIKGPDFPLGGCLINNNIEKLYTEGQASLTFKAKYFIENNHENNNVQIVFNELPPDVNKPKLVEKIYNLCIDKKVIPRVVDVRDESNGEDGIRIVIELHKTAILDVVLNELFNKTDLKQSVSYIMRCIDNQTPILLSLKEYINKYIEFHKEVYIRRYNSILNKTNKKLHIQEGYKKILVNLNKAIDIIRNSDDDKMAKNELIKEFNLSEEQADVILDMQLRRITKLGNKNIDDIIKDLNEKINEYNNILNNKDALNEVFINDLKELKKHIGDKRRTEIIEENDEIKNNVIEKDLIIALTNKNNIKHYEEDTFNDLIKKGYKEKSEIFLKTFKMDISNNLLLILNNGNYITLSFNDILGDINTLIEKQKIIDIIPCTEDNLNKIVLIMTKNGMIKKCYLNKFKTKKKLFNLIELDEDDEILKVKLINDEDNIITVASSNGLIHRFFVQSFKDTNPGGKGLGSMSLKDNVISDFEISNKNDDEDNKLIIYSKNNDNYSIKKLNLNEFLVKGRIAKGTKAINFTEKNPGEIYKIKISKDNFYIINNKGIQKEIQLNKIKESNKNSIGEKINYDILFIQ